MSKPAIQTFGKYQILERIATGGMAEIYKARLEGIGGFQRTFAIKRILPNLSQNSDYIAMLVDEAKVAGLLSHANIVQILDLGQVDGVWYIAMEFVDGPDLGAVLRRASEKGLRLPVPHAVFIAIELLKGLEYAHQRQVMRGGRPVPLNIIHRDISPPNVLLSYQGEVKLTDFGIARASLKVMETVSGIVKGRFDYMSSEQAAGAKDLDQRSDLFSVGVVLYEMLTGEHPFRADNEIATVERVRTGKYAPVSESNPEVPFTLETIIDRALRADRADRYPSATAFKEALDKFFHESGFIFTHATLASYVKGLFPNEAPKGRSEVPAEPRRVRHRSQATPTGTTDFDDEGPTRVLDSNVLERELARDQASESGFGLKGMTEEPTAIQANPLLASKNGKGFEEDQPTTVKPTAPAWDDEQETVIRNPADIQWGPDDEPNTVIRSSPYDDGDDTWVQTEPPVDDIELLQVVRSDPNVEGPTRPIRPPTPRPPVPRRPVRVGWLGVVLALMMLVLGVLGGALVSGPLVYMLAGPAPEVVVDPKVRIVAPERTSIMLDGDAVGPEFNLKPNVPHQLRISIPGYKPLTRKLVMKPGEVRTIVLEMELEKKH